MSENYEIPVNFEDSGYPQQNNNNHNKNKNKNSNNNNNQQQPKKKKFNFILYLNIFIVIYCLYCTYLLFAWPSLEQQVNDLYNQNQKTYNKIQTIKWILNWKFK